MTDAVPATFGPLIARLAQASDRAEREGSYDTVVRVADEILATPSAVANRGFAATIRLERAYALMNVTDGVSVGTAADVRRDLAEIRATLRPAAAQLRAVIDYVDGAAALVVATADCDRSTMVEASALLRAAEAAAPSPGARALAELLATRAEVHLGALLRTEGTLAWSSIPLRAYVDRLGAPADDVRIATTLPERAIASSHVTASLASFELWMHSSSTRPADTETDLTMLSRALAFLMSSADGLPTHVGPPLLWSDDISIAFCEVTLAGAAIATRRADGAMHDELATLVGRLPFGPAVTPGADPHRIAQTLAGLISTHRILQYAIFGVGRGFTTDEDAMISRFLDLIAARPTLAPTHANRTMRRALDTTIRNLGLAA